MADHTGHLALVHGVDESGGPTVPSELERDVGNLSYGGALAAQLWGDQHGEERSFRKASNDSVGKRAPRSTSPAAGPATSAASTGAAGQIFADLLRDCHSFVKFCAVKFRRAR